MLFTGINAFAFVDASLRQTTGNLQNLLLQSTPTQRLHAQVHAHFSDAFLAGAMAREAETAGHVGKPVGRGGFLQGAVSA